MIKMFQFWKNSDFKLKDYDVWDEVLPTVIISHVGPISPSALELSCAGPGLH